MQLVSMGKYVRMNCYRRKFFSTLDMEEANVIPADLLEMSILENLKIPGQLNFF
jgi:hypothetical protein